MRRTLLHFVLSILSLALGGCSTSTIKLSGTLGAGFTGHYRLPQASFDLSGAVPLVVEVPQGSLQECEFRKVHPDDSLTLQICNGKTEIFHVTAEPGALGVKAHAAGGWSYEVIR